MAGGIVISQKPKHSEKMEKHIQTFSEKPCLTLNVKPSVVCDFEKEEELAE